MVSIKTIADGLSQQIEAAIAGKADPAQAKVLCDSVATVINLARLQIEMAEFDWETSPEKPVLQMESSGHKTISEKVNTVAKEPDGTMLSLAAMQSLDVEFLKAQIVVTEKQLSYTEKETSEAAEANSDSTRFRNLDRKCKTLRKYLLELRDEVESR